VQHIAQFLVIVAPVSEVGSISLPLRTYQRIAVFAPDLTGLISMSRVEGHGRPQERVR